MAKRKSKPGSPLFSDIPASDESDEEDTQSDDGQDRRDNHRAEITIPGRFLTPDGTEYPCSVRDFSLNGIGFNCDTRIVKLGQHIIAYIEDLGRFEGPVTRIFDSGFAVHIELHGLRQERIVAKIQKRSGGEETTQATDQSQGSKFRLEDGTVSPCRILHISFGGAQIATHVHPTIGSRIMLGRMSGKVERYTPEGISIVFDDAPITPAAIPPLFR